MRTTNDDDRLTAAGGNVIDCAALPPEINSGLMYTGPGAGSLLEGAAAWDGLAAELRFAARSYASTLSTMRSAWSGPSSDTTAAAVTPYVHWLNSVAAQAELTGANAKAVAAAYRTAFAATVPPPAIAANRSRLAALSAGNAFGQNTPAIMATEAEYAQMWATDAAAMYGYAGTALPSAQLQSFPAPPQPTSGAHPPATVQPAAPSPVQFAPPPAPAQASPFAPLVDLLGPTSPLTIAAGGAGLVGRSFSFLADVTVSIIFGMTIAARHLQNIAAAIGLSGVAAPAAGAPVAALMPAAAGATVLSQLGGSSAVGVLSVPPGWAAATPAVKLAAAALQGIDVGAAPAASVAGPDSLCGAAALAAVSGAALGRMASRSVSAVSVDGSTPDRSTPDRSTPDRSTATPEKLRSVLADLAQKPESVQHWYTDRAGLDTLVDQLAKKPGIHAVHLSKASPTGSGSAAPRAPDGRDD